MNRIDEEARIVDSLAVIMRGKLRTNAHKPHWRDESLDALVRGFEREVVELRNALGNLTINGPAAVVAECADVANLTAMIADRILALIEDGDLRQCPPPTEVRALLASER